MSAAEFKRNAMDVTDWLRGAVSGGINDKQTIGQVVSDADFFVKCDIPAGTELKLWDGRTAERMHDKTGQYLPGGTMQLFTAWPKELAEAIEKLPALSTGWGKTIKRFVTPALPDESGVCRLERDDSFPDQPFNDCGEIVRTCDAERQRPE